MKLFFISLALISLIPAFGQAPEVPIKEGKPFYEKVIQIDSTTPKHTLYLSVKSSLLKGFPGCMTIVGIDDSIAGKVVAKCSYNIHFGHPGSGFKKDTESRADIMATIEVDVRDNGRSRIRLLDFMSNKRPITDFFAMGSKNGAMGTFQPMSYDDFVKKSQAGTDWALEALNTFSNKNEVIMESLEKSIRQTVINDSF